MFEANFSGHKKILGHKNWGALPPNDPLGYGPACKAKFSHLGENIAALCFWLNSSKSDDLRTNAFSKSAMCKSHEKIYFDFVDNHYCNITRSEDKCTFYL